MACADRYRRLAKPLPGRVPALSDRRRRRRSRRPLRLPCPGRAAPASARGRGRGLRRSRSAPAPCARPAVEMSSPTRTSRFGPMRPTDLTAASVWQTAHAWANSSRPSAARRSGARRRPPHSPCAGVEREHQRRARPARTRTASTTPSVTSALAAFDSVCSASRAPRGPPRIATKNTPRPSRTQKRTKAMTMRAGRYRVALPNGRAAPARRSMRALVSTFRTRASYGATLKVVSDPRTWTSVMNILRRLPLSRLLLLCGLVVALGVSADRARLRARHRPDAAAQAARRRRPRRARRRAPGRRASARTSS